MSSDNKEVNNDRTVSVTLFCDISQFSIQHSFALVIAFYARKACLRLGKKSGHIQLVDATNALTEVEKVYVY